MTEIEFIQKARDTGIVFFVHQVANGGMIKTGYFVDKEKAELWADLECMKTDYLVMKEKVKKQEEEIDILCTRIRNKGPVRVTRIGEVTVEIYSGENQE